MPKRMSAAERDARYAKVIELRRARLPFEAIGKRLEPPVSGPRAYQIYQEALTYNPLTAAQVDVHRIEALEMVDLAVRQLMTTATSRGTGPRVSVEAWVAVLRWEEHKAKLVGSYAPTRHELWTLDEINWKIRALEAEMGDLPDPADLVEGVPDALQAEIDRLEAEQFGRAPAGSSPASSGASG
jgi:uncharacterized small protein (DUF1192 family)